jgi:hypothetical protein
MVTVKPRFCRRWGKDTTAYPSGPQRRQATDGYVVFCPGGRFGLYEFTVENHGGRWTVTPP